MHKIPINMKLTYAKILTRVQKNCKVIFYCSNLIFSQTPPSLERGCKLNVHKTFRRCHGRLQNVLCTFNLCLITRLSCWNFGNLHKNYFKNISEYRSAVAYLKFRSFILVSISFDQFFNYFTSDSLGRCFHQSELYKNLLTFYTCFSTSFLFW